MPSVAKLMTHHADRVEPSATIAEAARLMVGSRISSVIVIEHHQAVMAHADWIIDLGPGAGHDGGKIVFQGTPEEVVATKSTLTGQHLASYLKG